MPAHAVALEDRQQLALGRRDPGEQAAGALVPDFRLGQAVERAAQIVRDREQILGETGDRIFGGVLALALGAAAGVLGLGQRPQQPVLVVGELGFERRHLLLGGELGRRHRHCCWRGPRLTDAISRSSPVSSIIHPIR